MKDNWSDQEFATDWDTDTAISNPSRSLLLDLLVSIVHDAYVEGNKVLDLGFGSGHVENKLFHVLPSVQIVGVDASDVMMAKAREKLENNPNIMMIKHDLNEINDLILPEGKYQIALTSFVLHEVPSAQKREIFEYIYKTLMPKGIYILVDRFKIDADGLNQAYAGQWNWQRRLENSTGAKPFAKYAEEMSAKEDSPDTMEDQLFWLREIGFKSACLELKLDRGLIVAVK